MLSTDDTIKMDDILAAPVDESAAIQSVTVTAATINRHLRLAAHPRSVFNIMLKYRYFSEFNQTNIVNAIVRLGELISAGVRGEPFNGGDINGFFLLLLNTLKRPAFTRSLTPHDVGEVMYGIGRVGQCQADFMKIFSSVATPSAELMAADVSG